MRNDRGRSVALLAVWAIVTMLLVPPIAASTSSLSVGVRQNMEATVFVPDGPGPYPGVLVLHTSGGLQQADLTYASRLSAAGYVCLVPAFMKPYGITSKTRQTTFTTYAEPIYADLVSALDTLRHLDKVNGSKAGAIGFSNGGYFAMWLAATDKVQAGVSYYGALSGAGTDTALARFRAAFTGDSAPVLILHGTADSTVPVQAAQHLGTLLDAAHSPYEMHLYPGAGHEFERTLASGADRTAADDAWQRTLAFLGKYLSTP